jgi:hypothetical protein
MEAVPCGLMFITPSANKSNEIEGISKEFEDLFFFSPKALTNNVRRTQIPFIINNL